MTTFDDTGMFELVEDTRGEPEPPRRARVVVVLGVAAALVVAGVVWLLAARGPDDAGAGQMTVSLLDRPAEPTDEVAAPVVDETGIDPATARFAVRTTAGQHYAALRWAGDLCLVAVPVGDAARVVCVAPSPRATVTISGEDGSRVRLGTDDAPPPDTAEGWRAAGPNVWVLDAAGPAAG
ncbi:hypothetical protein [Cellulomonas dongxiuzhuiae]|uniref:Anti-sigma factor n=1 Tax=Cellulomonas dongxiuzhuiae TaxID=2819979 RepID=A0ABX8GKK6_9CELL|nr:hypothetical protein [Cellulomonas dongxiuzhuiae]MBO3095693.1 hypothetical protein [Cellulomonas dongxiuzhuiae]QWC16644.1 hypothetical protein KKR89_03025 [Cellulomonas dongxiuzhuiae]